MDFNKLGIVVYDIIQQGPTRVIINEDGIGVPPCMAKNVSVDIIFIRNDKWSLGAPKEFEEVAYKMWPDTWVAFIDSTIDGEVRDILEYKK